MTKNYKKFLLFNFTFMALSGIALYILDDFFQVETMYGRRSHPWTSEVKFVHNLFNFLFLFSVGTIFPGHIALGLKGIKKEKRVTGICIFTLICLSTFSGVLLLYAGDETLLDIMKQVHFYGGCILVLILWYHLRFLFNFTKLKSKPDSH